MIIDKRGRIAPKRYVYPPRPPQPTPTPPPTTYTPQQFEAQYGFRPDVPSGAVITGVRETREGYQISYYIRGEPTPRERRKPFVGEPPPSAVGRKLMFLEGTLLMQRGYAFEPRKGVYTKYEEPRFIEPKLEAPKYPVGMPPATVLPSKFFRMEKGLLEKHGWVYEPTTEQFFKYEMVEVEEKKAEPAETWEEWYAMPGFRVATPYESLVYKTTKGEPFTTERAIKGVETVQEWLRLMPPRWGITRFYGKEWTYETPGETAAKHLELAYIPIGGLRAVEVPVALVPTVYHAITRGEVTPENIVKGVTEWVEGVKKQPITLITTFHPEQVAKHPGLVIGELAGSFLLAKHVYGPALGKAWGKVKGIGGRVKVWTLKKVGRYRYEPLRFEAGWTPQARGLEWRYKPPKYPTTGWGKPGVRVTKSLVEIGYKTGKKGFRYTPPKGIVKTPFETTLKGAITTPQHVVRSGRQFLITEVAPTIRESVAKQAMPTLAMGKHVSKITSTIPETLTRSVTKTSTKLATKLFEPRMPKELMIPLLTFLGPKIPSIYETKKKFHEVALIKLYPEEKPKKKKKTVPVALLKRWEIQAEKVIQLPKVEQLTKAKVAQTQKLSVLQIQTTQKIQKQMLGFDLMQKQIERDLTRKTPSYPPWERRRKGKRKKGFPSYGEEWFFQKHRLMTPREMAEQFTGSPKRRRKRRRK